MNHFEYDPIEDTEIYKAISPVIDREVEQLLHDWVQKWEDLGFEEKMKSFIDKMYTFDRFCFEKKKILKERYGIDWQSPTELNPGIDYDEYYYNRYRKET